LEMARLLHAGLPTNRNSGGGGEPTIIEQPTDQ
jgi:hypothetical protein